jgi:hypothetical protein
MIALIQNLGSYTAPSKYSDRLSLIRTEYEHTLKQLFSLKAEEALQKLRDLVEANSEIIPMLKDYIIANVYQGGVRDYDYGAIFNQEYGRFIGDEFMDHKENMLSSLEITPLRSY